MKQQSCSAWGPPRGPVQSLVRIALVIACMATLVACDDDDATGNGDAMSDAQTGFACGDRDCIVNEEYCQEVTGGAMQADAGSTGAFTCQPMTGQCRDEVECSCLYDLAAECTCTESPEDRLLVTCAAP